VKQPAKVSIVGAILAIVAAIFYPDLAGKNSTPAGETPNAAAPVAPPSNQPSNQPSNETPAPNKPPTATPAPTNPPPANPPATKPPVVDKPATPPPAKAPAAGPEAAKPPPTTPAPKPVTTPAVTPPKQPAQQPAPKPAQPAPTTSKVGFTSRRSWEDHFDKHGAEFGRITADEYLAKAQALRDAPLSRDILEATRKDDGVICRFDKRSGAFLAYHADKSIRTFFRPNDGEAYFRRQLNRLPQSDR
jgi:outer membrane biosynthesis protein TonB